MKRKEIKVKQLNSTPEQFQKSRKRAAEIVRDAEPIINSFFKKEEKNEN